MQVHDLVCFSKERCFNGAVQTEWFYDKSRVNIVAESYVFHGPKYFGVSDSDVDLTGHKLIDTASFTLNLAEKLIEKKPDNSFVLTIAGYGAGKSHLAVSLAALFSGNKEISEVITGNIAKSDKVIAEKIARINKKKNFVIVINGMNNFNLDAEILRCVRLVLTENGLNEDVLKELTKSYDIARRFVERTFSICQQKFETEAERRGIHLKGSKLKQHICDNIESSNKIVELVNSVYKDMTGDTIRWERGLSAGDIIREIYGKLCGEGKPFNKVLILFDEFGRYIEYVSANPAVAGEAALQQIFESVQSANGGIIFAGFVQSELEAYLARIEKTSNIMRYVGRYKASENLFLSSNFETILANLMQKVDEKAHERILNSAFARYERFQTNLKCAISRWDRATIKKSVWTNDSLYKSVIMRGCYPLHPITVWILANMNNWMQQRSAITFAAEMVDRISNIKIEGTWLPYVYPINIIDSSIYSEMLNSEEKGLVQSQYCMLYRDIQVKIGDKLNENELKVLKAVLIVNIGRFVFFSKEDAMTALRYCSNMKEDELVVALKNLENMHGVISYDENANTFDLIAEANGFNEFKRVYNRYQMLAKAVTIEDCDESIRKDLSLTVDIETAFAQKYHISSLEWRFKRTLMDSSSISEPVIITKLRELDCDYSGDGYRGEMIFAYCSKNSDSEIMRLTAICKKLSLSKYPLIIIFLDDSEGEIIRALTVKNVLNRFSNADNERFQKHVLSQHKSQNKKIVRKFNALVQARNNVTEEGLVQYQGRLNNLCTLKFEEVYDHALPFMFDGFENKTQTAARRYLSNVCIKMFDRTLMNIQSYNALCMDEKNRIKACLAIGKATSWQVYTNICSFTKPMEPHALEIFDSIESSLDNGETLGLMQIFGKFAKAPYGMNMNAIALFFFYYIAFKGKNILCYFGDEKLQPVHVSDKIFKGNKLQAKEFVKIRIQKNTYVDTDLVQEFCNEIMSCTGVEKCQGYKKKLNDLLAQEGTTLENQLLVASAIARLDEGIGLRDDMYDKLKKGQTILEEAKKSFSIQKFIQVFTYFVDTNEPVAPLLPFVYSDNYKVQMTNLKKNVDLLLKKDGKEAINKFSCRITQLSQFKNASKKMAMVLRNNGYEEWAKYVELHAVEVEEDLLARQKYEASLVDLDRDIVMATNVSQQGYSSCFSYLEKMRGWEHFFGSVTDMPVNLLNVQKEKIAKTIDTLIDRMNQISSACRTVIGAVNSVTSFDKLCQTEDKLNTMLSLGLNEEDSLVTNECLQFIALAKAKIDELPENIDELRQLKDTFDASTYGCCVKFVSDAIEEKLSELLRCQENWVARFISPVMSDNSQMNTVDCSNWLDRTSALPLYLTQNVLEQYKLARNNVEKQLHKSRIQGVFVMYDKLSDEEKREFKRMINA